MDACRGVVLRTTQLEISGPEIDRVKPKQEGCGGRGNQKLDKATNEMNATLSQNV